MNSQKPVKTVTFIILIALSSCSWALNLRVDFRWHDKPISIPTTGLVTPAGESFSLTRLDFLLNQPHLTLASGRTISASKWNAYIHGEKPEILRLPSLPDEPIQKLTLHLGPSDEINHGNANQYPPDHALNPLHNGLHWEPQSGYIFLALEGQLPKQELAFSYHYGNSENRLALDFKGPFDPQGFYQLTFHLDRVFPAPFRLSEQTSTHSRLDDPILPHFQKTLPQAFTLTKINSPAPQGAQEQACLLYTSPSPRDQRGSRMPSSA